MIPNNHVTIFVAGCGGMVSMVPKMRQLVLMSRFVILELCFASTESLPIYFRTKEVQGRRYNQRRTNSNHPRGL
jgi:hypothetical protein